MGRDSGYIALQTALAGGCEDVIIPERGFDLERPVMKLLRGISGKDQLDYCYRRRRASAPDVAAKISQLTSLVPGRSLRPCSKRRPAYSRQPRSGLKGWVRRL